MRQDSGSYRDTLARRFFDSLAAIHRYDDLEALLDYVAHTIVAVTDWSTALVTFYFGDDVYFGAEGCPPDTKERFRRSYERTSLEQRRVKRARILEFRRAGTNICFIPSGEGPRHATAYVPGRTGEGTWKTDDRLLILMRNWEEQILGIVSLDNPRSGNRPDEMEFQRLEEADRFVNLLARIAENRFWSLRLAASEQAYRGIFDASTDGMLITSSDGVIVEANQAVCRLHGYDYEELIGRSARDLIHRSRWDALAHNLAETQAGGEIHTECVSQRRDGTTFESDVRAVAFRYRGQSCMLAILQDATERKRVLEHMLAEQRDESIVAVAGGVAHDFNNLLMGITGSVSLLRADLAPGTEAARQCQRIAASSESLSRLTGQLLAIARGVHSEQKPVDMRRVVDENLPLIESMIESRFPLRVNAPEGLWAVHADRVQLGQILLNLAQNACEAMGRGGTLRIDVSNMTQDRPWVCADTGEHGPGDYVRLTLEDDGEGMAEDVRAHLFEPYYSTKPNGSGLGMAAVLGIVRRHHGAIQLESAEGRGTRVEILLPRCAQHPEPATTAAETKGMPGRKRILLVDDEDIVRDVAGDMLRVLEYDVVATDNGREALEIYERDGTSFDLVFLDVTMPGMTGVEVHEALRAMDPSVRVLFSSGHTERLVREGMDHGATIAGFIQKPYTLVTLREALEAALASE